ncbi:MAG TPA: trypsin-like peptidase domain-containing protein, partial [Acetobacteraceae bacterium]|nr:trypsin-like peptidase domain-containing protein [Acetobacteraceae bacterium]
MIGQVMRRAWILVALGISLPAFAGEVALNRAELIRSLLPSVVNLSVRKEVPVTTNPVVASQPMGGDSDTVKSFVGSGFVLDPSGLIATNYHVVDGAFDIVATLSDGTVLPARTLHASRLADLAIVQVDAGHPLTPVQWGDSTKLRVGDQVFAIGNPLGIGVSVSAGIVSGLNRNVEGSPYDDYIQTDAAINHGNSGGPLFDMDGHVVGVDTALVSPTAASAGLGLAIPADSARFVLGRLMQYGWVNPGWLGVKVQQVTPDLAAAMGSSQVQGSVVSWVFPESPAQKAGLAIGDVILRYGDAAPGDERALLRDIVRTPVGQSVQVGLLRDGKPQTVPVTIESWPRERWEARDAPMTVERPKIKVPADLGLSLKAVPTEQRANLGLEDGLTGVLVTGVLAGTDAAQRGMTEGDVILRVQDRPVATAGDVQQAIGAQREAHRSYAMLLVLPKVRKVPG